MKHPDFADVIFQSANSKKLQFGYTLQVFYHMVSVRPCSQIWVYQIVDFSRSRCAAAMKTTTDISQSKYLSVYLSIYLSM